MKPVRLSLALVGMALWLGCASAGRPSGGPLPAVEIVSADPGEVVLPSGGEKSVWVTVKNNGPQETTTSFLLLAGRDESVPSCGAESPSGWCFEAPDGITIGAGEIQQIEVKVAAPGRRPKSLPGARLFVRDNRGRDAASAGLGLRAAGS